MSGSASVQALSSKIARSASECIYSDASGEIASHREKSEVPNDERPGKGLYQEFRYSVLRIFFLFGYTRLRFVLFFVAISLCATGCARYQVGAPSLYSPDITTVYVPMIESKSLRRYLGERLTEAVVKEIEKQTPYKVVDADDADSILTARLVAETKKIKTNNRYDDGRENIISFQIEATWIDRRGEIIRRDLALPVAPEFASLIETGNYIPEIGQSVSTAQQTAIQRTAEQIVAMMEIPW